MGITSHFKYRFLHKKEMETCIHEEPTIYKLRAECTNDIVKLLHRMMHHNWSRSVASLHPLEAYFGSHGAKLTFQTTDNLATVRKFVSGQVDSHVMYQTVQPIDSYTGHRDYSIVL